MSTSDSTAPRTVAMARVIGPFLTIIAIATFVNARSVNVVIDRYLADPIWGWAFGSILLLAGCVVIALHPSWRGVAAVVVSLVGWLVALRGAVLLLFPQFVDRALQLFVGAALYPSLVTASVVLVLPGLYLTYVGWLAPHRRHARRQRLATTAPLPH